jgi:hypothetical protein
MIFVPLALRYLAFRVCLNLWRHSQEACVKADGEETLLLLIWDVDQLAEFAKKRLARWIISLGRLDIILMFVIPEPHDLHESAGRIDCAPVGSHLFKHFEMIAAEPDQGLAKPAQHSRVLSTLVSRNDVTVGLQKHSNSPLLFRLKPLCHKDHKHSNMRNDWEFGQPRLTGAGITAGIKAIP